MHPPIFEIAAASTAVKAALGTPPRLYLFGEAPQGVKSPYAVWQQVFGAPENYLGDPPDTDNFGTQIDVYAATAAIARGVVTVLANALETRAYVTAWNGESRDPETREYRNTFTVEFWVER